MLFVKTKLSYSPIHGIGLFANEFIKKGSVIWRFTPTLDRVYTQQELNSQTPHDKNFLETYCFKYFGKYYLCVDDARFMNHSSTPNCTDIGVDEIKDNDLGYTAALTDILPGEEITCDYRNFGGADEDDAFNLEGVK
jgi:uncharacterized protein